MSSSDLKSWMERNDKSVLQVAVMLKIHSQTVYKFLRGGDVSPVIQDAIRRLVSTDLGTHPGGKVAAG